MNTPKFIRSVLIGPPLYHLSLDGGLEGIWSPKANPEPNENNFQEFMEELLYPEPNIPRISAADTIEGCLVGVYPNIAKFFEKENLPWINLFVYTPIFEGDERIVTHATLTKDQLVWDAHITKECFILDKVEMKLEGEIKVLNPNKYPTAYTHPFNNKSLFKQSVGPTEIPFTWMSRNEKQQG